jgi:asparagine synthase (glutamine-hydrolysing)
MCGIAGIIGNKVSQNRILAMTAALNHRGPDESGLYLDDRAALGHTRLSIIDLSGGTQPIHNEDETLWIVFNGEIFNYPELRAELIAKGHRFYTTTDTEIILHLYEEKGPACLNDMNGQFAIAIWNTRDQTCFLARDRVGVRPLFYTESGPELIFASEIKSIFMNPKVPREIDPVAMDQVFTFWAPLPGRTPFKGIRELPAGHYLTFRNGKTEVARYWDFPFVPKEEQLDWSPDRISSQIQHLLKEATRIRLRADVPIGTYLSGGLDSSGITALVAQNFNRNVQTFGIRFDEEDYDEGRYQQEMVSFLGVKHTELRVSNADIAAALPDVIWHSEKPLLRTAPVPLYLLSKTVRAGNLKVVLTGEGSDEVFGGYNIFREACVRRFWAKFPASQKRAHLITHLYPYIFKDPKIKPMMQAFFAKGLDQTGDPLFSHLLRWENTARIKTYFSAALKSSIGFYSGYEDVRASLPEAFHTWDHLAQAQHLEMTIFMSNYLLSSQGDRMAMGNSVEIRMPYLDPHVMKFMGRVPAVWKILGLKEKYILKKSFRGILPDSIALRPKHPYRAPISGSLMSPCLKEQMEERLSEPSLQQSGLFDPAKVSRLIKKAKAEPRLDETDSMALSGILSAQMLYDRFIENFTCCDPTAISPGLVIDRRSKGKTTPPGKKKHENTQTVFG